MSNVKSEVATLGGGCFWCLEAAYQELGGVETVVSGYAGGIISDPSYYAVCSGRTRHAEVVQLTFNPQIITFREILEAFFVIHDPTTMNRQGADVGSQYRSVILFHNEGQEVIARSVVGEFEQAKTFDQPIVTEIEPFIIFWPAEKEHQNYYRRNPNQGYCQVVIDPKLAKLRKALLNRV